VEPDRDPTITPEPSPDERAAILVALDRLAENGQPRAYRSAWREEGIRENSAEDGSWSATAQQAGP
jgi:hypothetical protein